MAKLSITLVGGNLLAIALMPQLVVAGGIQQPNEMEQLKTLEPQLISNEVSGTHPVLPSLINGTQLIDETQKESHSPTGDHHLDFSQP